MNPLWLLMLAPPVYALIGGLTRTIVHENCHESECRKRLCEEWEIFPCTIWAGVGWPFLLPYFILMACALLGTRMAPTPPARKRELRDKKIAELERVNEIGQG